MLPRMDSLLVGAAPATGKIPPAPPHFPLVLLCIQKTRRLVGAQKKECGKVLRNLFRCHPYHFYEKKLQAV